MDLHGLHVKEAVAVLEREVAAARRASKPRSGRASPPRMSVLVGTGHHTKASLMSTVSELRRLPRCSSHLKSVAKLARQMARPLCPLFS